MSYNGSGQFLINSTGQPVVANTVISATVFNALTSDLATGLSTAITKDGQTTITANIPFGSNKITALGAGTAATDAANLGQVQSTAAKLITVTGTDTITGSMSPQLTAYAAGQLFYFVAAGANTGAVTINIDGLGAKSVTRDGSIALAGGDINSGEVVVLVYDGTRFQMINAANSFGNTTINGTLTVTGNTGLQANVSITSALSVGGTFNVTGAAALGSTLSVTGKSDLPTVSTASMNAAVALITTGTVTNLTATGASIASANIGNLQFTAASIASINAGVAVITNLTATGASIASANVGTAVITTGTVTNLTSTSASIASANAAVALVTTGTVTNLTSTSASIASANLGTAVISGLTVTGASIASVNVGAAVLSGNLTLNGGTANGVLYLNASKVATSGSALTFDGTTLTSNGGFKAAGSASSLAVDGAILDFNANYTRLAAGRAGGNFSSFELYVAGASGVTKRFDALYDTTFRWFDSAGTGELMRLTSTGLGIGTTSPATKLTVDNGDVTVTGDGSSTFGQINLLRKQVLSASSGFGFIRFQGYSTGTTVQTGAQILGDAPATWTSTSTPGNLLFYTTPSGSTTPVNRLTLDSSGNVGIGGTANSFAKVEITGNLPGTTAGIGHYVNATAPNGMTSNVQGFRTNIGTAAAAFTLADMHHFYAVQGAFGATSAVTNQFGFHAASSLTGATNNYGFYSDIASGSNRFNFYANGTATNYFAGNVGIGTASPSGNLQVSAANARVRFSNTAFTASTLLFGADSGSVFLGAETNAPIYFITNNTERMRITAAGSVVAGASAALATTATDGFLYVPTCAGTPTGTPTAITGMAPIVVDTTNNKLYFYSGGQWRDAGP